MVICLERGADLYTAQLMPLALTVSCFSKIQIGFTFLVLAHPGSPGKRAIKRVCVCVSVCQTLFQIQTTELDPLTQLLQEGMSLSWLSDNCVQSGQSLESSFLKNTVQIRRTQKMPRC